MYVLDTEAVLTIPRIIRPNQLYNFLDDLVEFVEQGEVCFPDAVIAECRRIASGEVTAVWIHAVSGSRLHKSIPHRHTVEILGKCSALLDEDAESDLETSPISVAALADFLSQANSGRPYVVSEDRIDLPTRMSLVTACDVLGFPVMDTATFINSLGFGGLLLG